MIQANELRLGNWLKTPNKINFRLDKMEHWGTDYSKCCMVTNPVLHDWTWDLKDMLPMQLTEEILEKAGYSWVNEAGGYADKKHFIDEWKVNDNHYFLFSPFCTNDKDCQLKVYSLHQLQNIIYSFTGSELEVVW